MPGSVQPISSAAFSSLIWELESASASALYGASPLQSGEGESANPVLIGRLSKVLSFMREKVIPRVWSSINTSEITIVRRSEAAISGDALGVRWIETTETLYCIVSGPTTETLEKGLLEMSDYEVVIPANTLGTVLNEKDAIIIGGVYHDIVAIQGYPKVPNPVAYRFWCKRAA